MPDFDSTQALGAEDVQDVPQPQDAAATPAQAELPTQTWEDRVKEEQAMGEDTPEPVTDPYPALSGLAPQLGGTEATDGVDMSTLPPFVDMSGMLPAQRVRITMSVSKLALSLPKHIREQGDAVDGQLDLDSMNPEDMDAIADMFASCQDLVLEHAQDSEAMTEWLLQQDNPLGAVMAAFTQLKDRLGN